MNISPSRAAQKTLGPGWKRGWPWQEGPAGRFSPFKAVIFAALLLPGLWLLWRAGQNDLGPRPVNELIHQTGLWGFRILLVSLAVTPGRQLLRFGRLALIRRMTGVSSAAYIIAHFVLFMASLAWDLERIVLEIAKANYLIIGLVALLGLCALAATSTDGMIRRLGGRRWQRLHYLVYPIAALGLWHFFLQAKADVYEPTLLAGLLLWLLGYRLLRKIWPRGFTLPWLPLVALGLVSAALTVGGEALYFGLRTNLALVPRVLAANLSAEMGVRPGIWVLAVVTGVTLAAAAVTIRARRT